MLSTRLPSNLKAIHFIGIGGIGMSGIAEVLLNLGYKVQGSDLKNSPIIERLEKIGAKIFLKHAVKNLDDADVVVVSSAISIENIELLGARKKSLPIVRRAEMLAELMRLKYNVAVAGSHGKTTTTSMISAIFDQGGLDPTVINGGIIQSYGSNARHGSGDWMVVEADESDGTFMKLPSTIAIVTNIDREHLEYYGKFLNLRNAFYNFLTNIPFYGLAICCTDHPEVQKLVGKVKDRRIITYGFNKQADFRVLNLIQNDNGSKFDVYISSEMKFLKNFFLPMPGEHNVLNALASITLSYYLKIKFKDIKKALLNFSGVKRRFTFLDEWNGVKIIDDYAHHPSEISAVLKASKKITKGKVIVVHQPHRYSRVHDLFDSFCSCFNEADVVGITNIFSAGEEPIEGVSKEKLVQGLYDSGHKSVHTVEDERGVKIFLEKHAKSGDLFICLGAGSISSWLNKIFN